MTVLQASIRIMTLLCGAELGLGQSTVYDTLPTEAQRLGYSVAGPGDLDGDGVPDFLAGAPWVGKVFVHSGATGRQLGVLQGVADEGFGFAAAGAGDVNRDGRPDLVVGVPYNDDQAQDAGRVQVFSGADFTLLHTLHGPVASQAYFGTRVAPAGDVDGDGRGDVLVTAPGEGSAWVFSGANGAVIHLLQSSLGADGFASSAHGGEDVNGDGVPDLVIGANRDDTVDTNVGAARVYSGADGQLVFTLYGEEQPGDGPLFGTAVALLGDLDGDGRSEVAVGAPEAGVGSTRPGRVQVFSGATQAVLYTLEGGSRAGLGAVVAPAGDVDGDGWPDLIASGPQNTLFTGHDGVVRVYSGVDGLQLAEMVGEDYGNATLDPSGFGRALAGIGDITGDGHSEVIIGVPYEDDVVDGGGRALVLDVFLDCNDNGVHDAWDLLAGTSPDCNGSGLPDECDISAGLSPDCNVNGVPDECDLAAGTSPDCNANSVPDECDVVSGAASDCDGDGALDECLLPPLAYRSASPEFAPLGDFVVHTYVVNEPPLAAGEVTLTLAARGDLDGNGEWLEVALNGTHLGRVFQYGFGACTDETDTIQVEQEVYNTLVTGRSATFTLTPRDQVSGCVFSSAQVTLTYPAFVHGDCNGNGLPDACDIVAGTSLDQDADGVPDECEFEVFCDAAVNSTGAPAAISWTGSNSVSANDLVLSAASLPTFASGLFIYSPDQDSAPLGNGVLCLGSTTQGFINRLPPEQSDAGGVLSHALDLTTPPVPASAITPGSTWNFSCWFRDVPAGGAGFNFSDGLRVTFQP